MEIRLAISKYILNNLVDSQKERLLTVDYRKAGIGFAFDFVVTDHSGFTYSKSMWVSRDDLGGYL